jgi:hypothetical protein
LLKKTILDFSTRTRRFISHRAERYLTLHVGEGEEIAFIGLNDILVETGCRLGAKLITRIYVLGWRTLTSHVGSGSVQHCVGAAPTTVKGTGLRIHENFIGRFYWRNGTLVLNSGKAGLKLIRHLLLHENFNLTIGSATSSHTTTATRTPDVPVTPKTCECLELNTASIWITITRITPTHGTILGAVQPLRKRRLVTGDLSDRVRHKLTLHSVPHVLGKGGTRAPGIKWNLISIIVLHFRFHGGIIARLQPVGGIREIGDKNITHGIILMGYVTCITSQSMSIHFTLNHFRLIKNINHRKNSRTQNEDASIPSNEVNETRSIDHKPRSRVNAILWSLFTRWPKLINLVSSDELLGIVEPGFHLV